jgi:hypothetical protein
VTTHGGGREAFYTQQLSTSIARRSHQLLLMSLMAQDQRRDGLQGHKPKAGFSRRHDGLRDRIYREAIRAGLLAHREYAPAVMRGLTDEQRKALDAASAAALHCEAGGC